MAQCCWTCGGPFHSFLLPWVSPQRLLGQCSLPSPMAFLVLCFHLWHLALALNLPRIFVALLKIKWIQGYTLK